MSQPIALVQVITCPRRRGQGGEWAEIAGGAPGGGPRSGRFTAHLAVLTGEPGTSNGRGDSRANHASARDIVVMHVFARARSTAIGTITDGSKVKGLWRLLANEFLQQSKDLQ